MATTVHSNETASVHASDESRPLVLCSTRFAESALATAGAGLPGELRALERGDLERALNGRRGRPIVVLLDEALHGAELRVTPGHTLRVLALLDPTWSSVVWSLDLGSDDIGPVVRSGDDFLVARKTGGAGQVVGTVRLNVNLRHPDTTTMLQHLQRVQAHAWRPGSRPLAAAPGEDRPAWLDRRTSECY